MREAILHVGLAKTGSTSIQRVLARRRDSLPALGAWYPESPGAQAHVMLPIAVAGPGADLPGAHMPLWRGMSPRLRIAAFRREFAAEMEALPDAVHRVVFSAETLGITLRDGDSVARLRDLLSPWFDRFRVVAYLRRQDQFAASMFGQWLREGLPAEPRLADDPDVLGFFDHEAALTPWAEVFGEEAVAPRVFERAALAGGDVVDDFLELCGLPLQVPPDDPGRAANTSLGLEGQALTRRLIARLNAGATVEGGVDSPLWRRLVPILNDALPGRGWQPSAEEAASFLAHFAESNERVRRRWFPDRPSLFDPEIAEGAEAGRWPDGTDLVDAALDALIAAGRSAQEREAQAALVQARLLGRLGEAAGARAALGRALAAQPDNLLARVQLADRLLEAGETEAARQQWAEAARLSPTHRGVLRLARRLGEGDGPSGPRPQVAGRARQGKAGRVAGQGRRPPAPGERG